MRLAVISHKVCWKSENSPSGYATDGGFPMQMQAISELFSETRLVLPCENGRNSGGIIELSGNKMSVVPLSVPKGKDLRRKLAIFGWFFTNGRIIWREVKQADAVHAPIPGDVGTIGIVFALLQRKRLFVRYCGNWTRQKTTAEKFWRFLAERFAGGQNVILATGGDEKPPSAKNLNIEWIFSTSLREKDLSVTKPRQIRHGEFLKLIIVCRQEKGKGTEILLESLSLLSEKFPQATLQVIGDGSLLSELKQTANRLEIGNRVIFHGKVTPKQVIELLKKADIFCFPTQSEGFPKAVLEALTCGLPVVTTPVSVLPKLIGESKSGKLLTDLTAESLAEAVAQIYENEILYREMSANAVQTAKQYSLEKWRDLIGEKLRRAWKVESLSEISR